LVDKVEQPWADLREAYAGLTEAQMAEPGVTGEWSVKDILAHVTTWEEEALQALPVILRGEALPRYADVYGSVDAFNAQASAKKRDLPLAEVLMQMEAVHAWLLAASQDAPEEEIATDTRVRRRIRLDTYSHYPGHARAIREGRERLGR